MTHMVARRYYPDRAIEFWIQKRRVSGLRYLLVALARRDAYMLRCWAGV